MNRLRPWLVPFLAAAASCAPAPPATAPLAPPAAAPFVIAANPLAAKAGIEVLKRGGSAIDATVAVQALLGLVEPQSSGIGGGAFLTYFDGSTGKITVYDGREVAPARATPTMFLGPDGKPLPFETAVLSGRSTGVPGAVAMLALAQKEHGQLAWRDLFGDAIRTADAGFTVSPRLGKFIASSDYPESRAPDVRTYFARPGGGQLRPGDTLRNPAYAAFLRRLASEGPSALYGGSTAARIVERTHQGDYPGTMTMADLAAYRPVKREPLCGPFRVYLVCAPPAPASGAGILELLGLLDRTDIAARGPNDPQAWFLLAVASRLMYADRDQYIGDPAFVSVPQAGLIDPAYLMARARLIGPTASPDAPPAGIPANAPATSADRTLEPTGTSHVIIRDAAGNVVSMTTTVESIFGSGRMVDGFFLNNQLTDFSFSPVDSTGRPAANAVAPGKRPRSSMVPLIVLDRQGRFAGAFGSAGGSSILAYVGKAMVAAIDWNEPVGQALAEPNLVAKGTALQGEVTKFAPAILDALRAKGIDLKPGQGEDSGLTAVMIRDHGRIDGGADPRREGVVLTLP